MSSSLVAIDYFTKWVEAASYARLTSSGVASFIRSHIICRYGVPHELISDRGTNGAVEAANKNIKRILRKMVETSRDWSEKLPFALWAIGLLFAPLQEPHHTHCIRAADSRDDWAQARFDQLNLLDERRLRAADHVRAYQRKMARAFKKRVKPTTACRELTPEGAAWLMDLDGNQFSEPTNVDQLKSSYVSFPGSLRLCIHFVAYFVSEMSDFLLGALGYCPFHHYMPYWGIFRFGGSLWIFAEVTCSRIDDSMLSDLRPILHFDAIQGHISVRMRFTDHEGVACLSLSARSRFILFDVVVIPGWGYVECLDPHVIISVRYTSGLLCIPMVLFSGHQGRSESSSSLLSFGVQSHHRFSDRHSESPPRFRRSESLSFLSLTFRVIIITSQFRRSELSSVFRSTFRVSSSVSAFRVVITSEFDVQSHHHHFSVSAFRAIIGFQIDIQSRILGFGVQSRYHFSV
ncbi:hypothetical protein CK203_110321 [Vitis vinifera]|uniref:Integrase catalytic domain-containing protein n=1 Tax=Vitis vinifera TaxID=29760 RepID=A0A438CVU4_VITVI|nr:hypothetical protein CK203_110321 [Vitis vinifera]